jgi:hypothetical protein
MTLQVGNKIKMCNSRTRFTIQAFDERFIIATKRHFGSYLYTLIDREKHIRGGVNKLFGFCDDVDTPEGAHEALQRMREDGGYEVWHVSPRSRLDLTSAEIAQIGGAK